MLFLPTIITAAIAFFATNLDDLVLLVIFFAQAPQLRWQTIAGEYLGFCLILLCSLPGFVGGVWLPKPWLGLLGLVPIALGLRSGWQMRSDAKAADTLELNSDQASEVAIGVQRLPRIRGLHPQMVLVALAAFFSGGDNLGVYVPLFASLNGVTLVITLGIFLISVGIWCGLALYLVNHAAIAPMIQRYGDRVLPWVLIGLGIYIFWENQSWQLFIRSYTTSQGFYFR
ncbi:MAG: cadmium resistance transporter [Synechococcales bacterium]|nr:cadmium resistance transporter [Synechococcales bacterium]